MRNQHPKPSKSDIRKATVQASDSTSTFQLKFQKLWTVTFAISLSWLPCIELFVVCTHAVVDNYMGYLQSILLDSLYGTERGLNASNEVRSEISELLTQLEAKNPTPAPTEVLWKSCAAAHVQRRDMQKVAESA